MHRMHRLILLFSVSALAAIQPAAAQFEVSPDHFDNPPIAQTPQSARAEQKLRESIAEEQAMLDHLAGQLAAKAQQVETLREEAISAGIGGDSGAMYITAFRAEQQELQALQASLTPLMDFARQALAGLHNDLYMLEAGTPAVAGRRTSRTLQASARTGR
jgi:hypothetical protein